MPELPEVETIRQDLRAKILNKKIVHVKVYNKKSTGNASAHFIKALTDNAIKEIDRRGKLMIWELKYPSLRLSPKRGEDIAARTAPSPFRGRTEDGVLLVHLKMTGQLIYEKETRTKEHGTKIEIVAGGHKMSERDINALPNQWTRIAFVFNDGGELFFNDQRLFGYMKLVTKEVVEKALNKFGPEPFPVIPVKTGIQDAGSRSRQRRAGKSGMTIEYFTSLFKKRAKTTIKAMLLNQELIAGLGNIYVDEVCFCAGVRPTRRVGSVTIQEQKKLFACIPKILHEALRHRGTTFRNFLDSSGKKGNYTDFLKVYDRDGQPCKRCKTLIQKTRAAGRGTHYCPKCQK